MKKKKLFFALIVFCVLLFVKTEMTSAQVLPTYSVVIGELVTDIPDSIYKAKVDVFVADSTEINSIHLIVFESSTSVFDDQFVISSLPVVSSAIAWKDEQVIHIDIPDVNPFIKRRYYVAFLSSEGQLLFQIENEF